MSMKTHQFSKNRREEEEARRKAEEEEARRLEEERVLAVYNFHCLEVLFR